MPARPEDRRHVRQVELGLEAKLSLEAARCEDEREDAAMGKAGAHARRILCALREAKAFDELEDQKRDRAIELMTELVGLLDGVQPRPILEEALAMREAQGTGTTLLATPAGPCPAAPSKVLA